MEEIPGTATDTSTSQLQLTGYRGLHTEDQPDTNSSSQSADIPRHASEVVMLADTDQTPDVELVVETPNGNGKIAPVNNNFEKKGEVWAAKNGNDIPNGKNGKIENGHATEVVPVTVIEPSDKIAEETGEKKKLCCFPAKEKKEKPKMVSTMQLFRFATKLDYLFMIVGTICAMLHGAALPCMLIVFGDMTDSFVDSSKAAALKANMSAGEKPVIDNSVLTEEIRKASYAYSGIGFAVLIVGFIRVTLWLQTSHRQTFRIRLELLRAVLRQEIGWFDTHDAGELGTRLADDVNKIQEGIGDKFANFFQWTSAFIAGIVIGLCYGWKLALVIFAVSPLLAVCGGFMTYLITSTTSKELAAYAKAGAVAEEVLGAIRTVVAFSGQTKECERYTKNLTHAKDFGIYKSMVSGGGMGFVFLIIFSSYALAFWYGGKLTREEQDSYSIGVMLIVFFCVVIGAFSLGNAAPNLENIGTARGAAYIIWDIIDRKPVIDSSSDAGLRPTALTGQIELKDVVFRYPSRDQVKILNGLSLVANKGQTVALVGSSGCGKSTVVQLLQRFYDPLAGTLLIDGIDIRDLNIKWLRQNIGIVSQEPVLFATTIAENIRYGRDGVSQAEIESAAREANAHDFISKLPMKYETLVGERGAQLSGGQKQRIAIARALVRDPRILLLDEATSALDTESEATVQAALDKARMGRTTIVIAHRLSTIRTADVIYGVQDGVVHESGTHAELMQQGGIYYQLVMNQQTMEEENIFGDGAKNVDLINESTKSLQRMRSPSLHSAHNPDLIPEGALVVPDTKKAKKLKDPPISRIMALNIREIPFIIIGCIAAIVQGGVQPAFAIIFSTILGVFGKPDLEEQEKDIFFYSMMFIVIGVGSSLAMFFQAWMFGISGERLTMKLRQMTFRALLRQEISFFDDHDNSVGALTTRLSTDASAIQGATGARLGMLCQSFASIGTGLIIGFVYSWELALFICGFVPFFLIGGMLEMKIMKGFSGKNEALEHAGKVANEAIVNIRTVASLSKEQTFCEDYERLTGVPYRDSMRKANILGFTFAFSQSLLFFAYAAIFTFGAWLITHRGLEFQDMFKVFAAIIFGAMAIGQASQFAPDYGKAKAAAARVFTLLDQLPMIDSYSPDGATPSSCTGNIEFSDVHFSYPTRSSVAVLRGLDVDVDQSRTVALVGSSGCGKSTSVQLLERFYDPSSGKVMLDGHDIKDLNIQWLRSQIGIVSQEPTLFDCSIAENIAYGDNSRTVQMDEIIEAAQKSNIHNFIASLPQGYDTNVGDKGAQLSGGQKQRVAIARALVRNPKILLLDEATSALDTESEKVVQEALDRAQQGRTSLVIAHRLSTIQNAHKIVVIHNGQVAEQGTHSELLAQRGLYYKLQLAQGMKR